MQNDKSIRKLIKSLPVLLQGRRNSIDGCWDIPVCKTVLQQNNYKKPLTHSGLYARRQNNLNSSVTQVHDKNTLPQPLAGLKNNPPRTKSKILRAYENSTRKGKNNLPELHTTTKFWSSYNKNSQENLPELRTTTKIWSSYDKNALPKLHTGKNNLPEHRASCDQFSRCHKDVLQKLHRLPRTVVKAYDTQIFKHLNLLIDENIFDARIKEFTDADKSYTTDSKRSTPKQHTVNIIVRKDKLKPALANFHHASMFSPV